MAQKNASSFIFAWTDDRRLATSTCRSPFVDMNPKWTRSGRVRTSGPQGSPNLGCVLECVKAREPPGFGPGAHEAGHDALAPLPRGPPGRVQVAGNVARHIVEDDVPHLREVEAPRRERRADDDLRSEVNNSE